MAEAKHTPGPWLLIDGAPFVYATNNEGTNRFSLQVQTGWAEQGKTRTSTEELRANAALIAAAPDLLAALQTVMSYPAVRNALECDDNDAARAAIAKALGEPQ